MTISPSTKRSIRTLYQGAIALLTVVPAFVALLPSDSPLAVQLSAVVVGIAAVSKVINKLEDAGLIPAWFKE